MIENNCNKIVNLSGNDLADKYSVSAERIRQIEATAFKKLKSSLVNV